MFHALVLALLPPTVDPALPPLSDLERFPPPQVVADAMDFNRTVTKRLHGQQSMRRHLWWEYQEILDGCNESFWAWDALDDAQSGACGPRREALRRLKDRIGPAAYFAGRMPPAVPYWLFQEID